MILTDSLPWPLFISLISYGSNFSICAVKMSTISLIFLNNSMGKIKIAILYPMQMLRTTIINLVLHNSKNDFYHSLMLAILWLLASHRLKALSTRACWVGDNRAFSRHCSFKLIIDMILNVLLLTLHVLQNKSDNAFTFKPLLLTGVWDIKNKNKSNKKWDKHKRYHSAYV